MKATNSILAAIERAEADEACRYALLHTEGNQAHLLVSYRSAIAPGIVRDASPVVVCGCCQKPAPRDLAMPRVDPGCFWLCRDCSRILDHSNFDSELML